MDGTNNRTGDVDRPEHDCTTAGTLVFVAYYGAPGTGQAWACATCGTQWARVGDTFWPADQMMHILSVDDVE